MTVWETEDEYAAAARASLPTPNDTPYRTPKTRSRRSSRQKSNSPGPSSSPPPLASGEKRGRDIAHDESISILDPRRFTPTLHANLVSEILALRRDQDDKTKIIESLESALHETRGRSEKLETTLGTTSKENRSLNRQISLLEGGSSSALSDLARERDEAVELNVDNKKRLEAAQKKIRAYEDDSNRVHDLWARDKDEWANEKRQLERKVHAADSRLKKVLDDIAAYEASYQNGQVAEGDVEDPPQGHFSDTASVRTMSMTNSIQFSLVNGASSHLGSKQHGTTLADELDFTEGEELTDCDGRESIISARHSRNESHDSVISKIHGRNQSMESLMRPGSVARGRKATQQALEEREERILESDENSPLKTRYTDTGIQFSPPSSPGLPTTHISSSVTPIQLQQINTKYEQSEQLAKEMEVEANQRRKRVHVNSPLIIEPSSSMVSASSQTLEDPLSPPRTPSSPSRSPPLPPMDDLVEKMISSSTQTDETSLQPLTPLVHVPIPFIQLHPPNSRPATPREPLLPQHSKDVGCQVSLQISVPCRSTSVQTEEIRVDKRLNTLPPHLQPSAISSKPPSPEPDWEEARRFSPVPGNLPPPRNPKRMKSFRSSLEQEFPSSPPPAPSDTRDAYPGNNDDGPLARDRGSLRRPPRISSLFAGFDNNSSDDGDDFADADMSENDYQTALSAPKPSSMQSRVRRISGQSPHPENMQLPEVYRPPRKSSLKQIGSYETNGEINLTEAHTMPPRSSMKSPVRQLDKPLSLVLNNSKPSNAIRRVALISSGVAAHQGRSRSPSVPDLVKEPPFPIPTRASSRRPPHSTSAPGDGNRSPTLGRGGRGHRRSISVRKVRSATALPGARRTSARRQGSRSPPPMSASTEAPESPGLPPLPSNEVTTPGYMRETGSSRFRSHTRQAPSGTTAHTANTVNTTHTGSASAGSSNATSVVDAIAQTMVGEWMFKYVRRRKSFGVGESNGLDENSANGVRHKRWVWLAPYERAVMWSSKQPTTGSALMGKTGRKLIIQSVLDVKDDNAPPKGNQTVFSRSILILTPARALKFTATTAERHYIWLTALSFLAHSSQAVPELVSPPATQGHQVVPALLELDFSQPVKRLRKPDFRDSFRTTKSTTATTHSGLTEVRSCVREDESSCSRPTTISNNAAADAPIVPRFAGAQHNFVPLPVHTRKRSNTGPRVPPPLSFRGFSGPFSSAYHAPTNSTAGLSVGSRGSDIYNNSTSQPSIYNAMSVSGRSSEASQRAAGSNNFFDAVGTMRMEAFISPMASVGRFDDFPDELEEQMEMGWNRARDKDRFVMTVGRKRGEVQGGGRRGSGHRDRAGFFRADDWSGNRHGEEEWGNREPDGLGYDPFRGF